MTYCKVMSLDEHRTLKALREENNTTIEVWQEDCDDMSFGDVWNGMNCLPSAMLVASSLTLQERF
jgi:hypothetical protein